MHVQKMGVADHLHSYIHPFTTRNQVIKMPEKVDQTIKQALRDRSRDQAAIKFLITVVGGRKYRAHTP